MEGNFLGQFFTVIISAIFINNFVLARFVGLCPLFGLSKKVEPSIGMGLAVIFVTGCSSLITSILYNYVLVPLNIEYLRIVVFIIVIASFVQFVEIYLRKVMPGLYKSFGVYLVLITTNCAVLGASLFNIEYKYGVILSTIHGLAAGAGFLLAIVILSYIRERLELADVPQSMRGLPIAFIAAGLLSIAFMGFAGLVK